MLPLDLRSELVLLESADQFVQLRDCAAIVTPDNPGFYWGNALYLFEPPAIGSREHWLGRFDDVVRARVPDVRHVAIGWMSEDSQDVSQWDGPGWETLISNVMTLQELKSPTRVNLECSVRVVSGSAWSEIVELGVVNRELVFSEESYRQFMSSRVNHWRRLAQEGRGAWFAGYLHDTIVSACGVYFETSPGFDGQRVGRFQYVMTHPDFRRQSLCRTVMFGAASWAIVHAAVDRMVIIADLDNRADRVYEDIGFVTQFSRFNVQFSPARLASQNAAREAHELGPPTAKDSPS